MASQAIELTGALEDYLETVYELVRDNKFARVRDIARARDVRAASVSPAMKRLADLGLIRYVRREYIDLTEKGEEEARKVYARHQVLKRLFGEVLGLPDEQAEENACAMEHSVTPEAMSRLVRFFEFLGSCPEGSKFVGLFNACKLGDSAGRTCSNHCDLLARFGAGDSKKVKRISSLRPGEKGVVVQVKGRGAIRQRLLDMGILPDVTIELERVAPTGDPLWIKLQGFQLSLRKREAETVLVATG